MSKRKAEVVDLCGDDDDDDDDVSADLLMARRMQEEEDASARAVTTSTLDTDAAFARRLSGTAAATSAAADEALARRMQAEDDAARPAAAAVDDLAVAMQMQQDEYGGPSGSASSSASAAPTALDPDPPNRLGLDFARCEVLRGSEGETPVVLFRAVGGGLAAEAAKLATFSDQGSGSRCGAAVNSGTNGKNCSDTYRVLADTQPQGGGAVVVDDAALLRWQQAVVETTMAAAAAALRGGGHTAAAATLRDLGPQFVSGSTRTAEVRVLKYAAPKRADKSKVAFHRHLDHGHYGWVVLASLRASCDFYLRLKPEGQPDAVRILTLNKGDLLVFDASRKSDVEHGVDAVHRSDAGHRVSVQWRVVHPERWEKVRLAWMAKNLAEFPAAELGRAFDLCGLERPSMAGVGARQGPHLGYVQLLISRANSSLSVCAVLYNYVAEVCAQRPEGKDRFLAKRVGCGGRRSGLAQAWHVDKEITAAPHVWLHDRVPVPAYHGAPGTPFKPGPADSRAWIRLS